MQHPQSYFDTLPKELIEMLFYTQSEMNIFFSISPVLYEKYWNNETYWRDMFYRYVRKFDSPKEYKQYLYNKNINDKGLDIKGIYLLIIDAYQKYNLERLAQYGAFDMIVYLCQNHQFQKSDITLALRLAALNGFYEIVQILLDSDLKLELKLVNRDYSIALDYASQTNHLDIINLLLMHNSENVIISERYELKNYLNAMESAANYGHINLVLFFLEIIGTRKINIGGYCKLINNATSSRSIDIVTLILSHAQTSGLRITRNELHIAKRIAKNNHDTEIYQLLDQQV